MTAQLAGIGLYLRAGMMVSVVSMVNGRTFIPFSFFRLLLDYYFFLQITYFFLQITYFFLLTSFPDDSFQVVLITSD